MKVTKSTRPVSAKKINRNWHLIDLTNQTLGRVSNEIAKLLQGKQKVDYVPNLDAGDFVVAINAKKIVISGSKKDTKEFTNYSGYPGGLRTVSVKTLMEKKPGEVVRHAVSGMLPKNKLRDRRMTRLYIYADENHPHSDKIKS